MTIEYRSVSDLNETILKNLSKIPHEVDLVVGVPRSGMLPANLIALYLNKPYTDIDSFIDGRIYGCGFRKNDNTGLASVHKVLVVDDSINSGAALRKTKSKLSELQDSYEFKYFVVYATKESRNDIDVYCETIPWPRFFQWNIFHHHAFLPDSCFDIDGVLCEDPPVDDDGEQYMHYIANAKPKYIPTVEIGTIVTCRLEKYRSITEKWLLNNNIKYKKLVMLDMNSKEERIAWGRHGEFKGNVFKKESAVLFVESSLFQAKEIARIAQKPVFCTETFSLVNCDNIKTTTYNFLHNVHVGLYYAKLKLFDFLRH